MKRPDLFVSQAIENLYHSYYHQSGPCPGAYTMRPRYCPVHRDTELWIYNSYFQWYKCPQCEEPVREADIVTYACPICDPTAPMPPPVPHVSQQEVGAPLERWDQVNVAEL